MNQVPSCFLSLLNNKSVPENFSDIVGFCLYKGLKLNFSANKNRGYYFGYFTQKDDSYADCDSFRFENLNDFLFKKYSFFNNYILNNKVIVTLYRNNKNRKYILELKEVKYNKKTRKYESLIIKKVMANSIEMAFIKISNKIKIEIGCKKNNSKVLYLDKYRCG